VLCAGSWLAALAVGLVLATTLLGLPLDAQGDRVGSAFAVFRPELLSGAFAVAGFALLHGATFLA
jgi:cytochrome d ubiquinol oxidase subunit II